MQFEHAVAAGLRKCGIGGAVERFRTGDALCIVGRQQMFLAAHEQPRRRVLAVRAAPGHARPWVALQRGAVLQVPFDLDARALLAAGMHLAGGAVDGDEAAEPVAEAVRVVHAQQVQGLDRAVHRRRVDLVGDPRRRQVGIGVTQGLVGVGRQGVDEVAEQFGGDGARMPTEKVRQASSATPWCGTPGGR